MATASAVARGPTPPPVERHETFHIAHGNFPPTNGYGAARRSLACCLAHVKKLPIVGAIGRGPDRDTGLNSQHALISKAPSCKGIQLLTRFRSRARLGWEAAAPADRRLTSSMDFKPRIDLPLCCDRGRGHLNRDLPPIHQPSKTRRPTAQIDMRRVDPLRQVYTRAVGTRSHRCARRIHHVRPATRNQLSADAQDE